MVLLRRLRVRRLVLAGTRARPLFGIPGRKGRPVVYVRQDIPADALRSNAYRWMSNRRFGVGDTITGIPGWGRVVVVDEPFMRHGVEHVPVEARAPSRFGARADDQPHNKRRNR